jgi:hypothetical protein
MSGFYKNIEDKWFFAPNAVYNTNYILLRLDKDTYNYPVDGWFWCDNEPEGYVNPNEITDEGL